MWNLSLGSPLIGFQSSGDESFGLVFRCSGLQNTQQQLWFWCRLQCTQVTFNLPLLSYNSCWLSGEAWPEEFPLFFSMSGDVLLYLLKLLLRYCRGTVSKQLEVVIEHLGRGCCWQGNMGQLFAAVLSRWPERLQPPWAHKRASHRRGDITWTCAAFWERVLCSWRDPSSVGWVWFFFLHMVINLSIDAVFGVTEYLCWKHFCFFVSRMDAKAIKFLRLTFKVVRWEAFAVVLLIACFPVVSGD